MRNLVAALATSAVTLAAGDASAKCARPGATFEPASGVVPATPVLRLFAPSWSTPGAPTVTAIDASGKKLAALVTTESTADAFTTYRVAFPKAAKGKLLVRYVDPHGSAHDADYAVDPAWKAPVIAAPALTVGRVQSSWTCSHQLTRNVRFTSVAPAYRLTFAPTKAALAKSTTTLVLPANVSTMFGMFGASASTPDADLALGHVNCMGHTYTWSGGVFARVQALLPDGSEVEIAPALWLDPP